MRITNKRTKMMFAKGLNRASVHNNHFIVPGGAVLEYFEYFRRFNAVTGKPFKVSSAYTGRRFR